MKFTIAEKLEMTQIYKDAQKVIPVTKVKVNPCVVTQLKNEERDGYEAVQVSCGEKKHLNKALKGHLANVSEFFNEKAPKYISEFRTSIEGFNIGDVINASVFSEGDRVFVRGVSKGKGFQGVVKRHGFGGSPASHGHKDQLRMPGSIGEGTDGGVPKGKRMGGRMGSDSIFIRNLEVVKVEGDFLYIKGALPGARGGYLEVFTEGDEKMELKSFKESSVEEKKEVPAEVEAPESSTPEADAKTEASEVKEAKA